MMRWTMRIANCFLLSAIIPLAASALTRLYTAENYDVSIQADMAKQRLSGEVRIRLHSQVDMAISGLELDADELQVTSVAEGPAPQPFEQKHGMLLVILANPLRPDEHRTITVRYQAAPSPGLKFFHDQIYTSTTTDWMPCNDLPGERATLHLTIAAPPDTKAAGSGQLTATRATGGQSITEWQLDSPTAPSWFGFALGAFTENASDAAGVKLRVLGAGQQVFEPTTAAIRYLSERTGKPYPGQTYTQVFVHGDAIHSMAGGLTLLPESQPDNLRLLTSELAKQWYGVEIAAKDGSDVWLSKGISAYLADLFLGQRFGKDRYDREIEHSLEIYSQLRGGEKDRPLSDTRWRTRPKTDSEIPEHKGVCFLHLLHQLVGDNAFWNGLRLYTASQWGQAATSEDLQKAFYAVNTGHPNKSKKGGALAPKNNPKNGPRNLDDLFDLWVYGIPLTDSK